MTSSGTYSFAPTVGDLTLAAFGQCLIRRTEITQQHLADAALQTNLLQSEISSRQPNLWLNELYELPLTAGVATYTLPSRLISPMAVYLNIETSDGNSFDRILGPISTFEYSSLPDKTTQAQPTCYWLNRQIEPVFYLWPVPDDNATYTLKTQILSQPQDANLPSGVTPNLPYRWYDYFSKGLAARMARLYPEKLVALFGPTAVKELQGDAERAWAIAASEDIEYVPTYILPMTNGYWR